MTPATYQARITALGLSKTGKGQRPYAKLAGVSVETVWRKCNGRSEITAADEAMLEKIEQEREKCPSS